MLKVFEAAKLREDGSMVNIYRCCPFVPLRHKSTSEIIGAYASRRVVRVGSAYMLQRLALPVLACDRFSLPEGAHEQSADYQQN